MSARDDQVYSKRVRARLDVLEARKHAAELKVRDIERQIEELLVGQSPIGPNAIITWVRGNRHQMGRVLSVRAVYRGFEYRVEILGRMGGVIGMATVSEQDHPTLLESNS